MVESLEKYQLDITSIKNYKKLFLDWQTLESSSNASFFLSSTWIETWLSTYSPDVDVLSVKFDGVLVGLALLCRSQFSHWKRLGSKRLHINQTGNQDLDQIWTEYNGVLSSVGHEPTIHSLVVPFLLTRYDDWDELHVGAVTQQNAQSMSCSSGLSRLDLWQSPSYGVDLKSLSERKVSYLDSLSRNTRYQIRRSLKLYASEAPVSLNFASSVDEALSFFNEIAPLHLARWGAGVGKSGFANQEFMAFHFSLITKAFGLDQIDLIKVQCGERTLGYLYNFLYRGRVYFYLSGLVSENDAKLKPGLCAHSLAIQHYLELGYDFYDFMGGDDRYKASLGTVHEHLFQISLQKKRFKFKIESFMRKVKQRMLF